MNIRPSPTVALLNASTLTAISGSTRLYLAFLLAGLNPDGTACIAAGFVIYSTYTLDRALGSEEDAINKTGYCHARRDIGCTASLATFIIGTALFVMENFLIAPFIPFVVGFFYTKGIRIRDHRFRLKGSLGGKNLVIGLTWGGTIALVIAPGVQNCLTIFVIFLFFFTKLFINSAIYDMKDTEGDKRAGVRTLPVVLGDYRTKQILAGMCASIHSIIALCMVTGVIRAELSILFISVFSSLAILSFYSSTLEQSISWIRRNLRVLLIDCEAPATLVLRTLMAGSFFASGICSM